nr:unnamed protein product [Callosobruchus chinensis]
MLSHRLTVGDLSFSYRYSNEVCSSELTSIIPPLTESDRTPARLLHLTPRRSFFLQQEPSSTNATFFPGCLGTGMDCWRCALNITFP